MSEKLREIRRSSNIGSMLLLLYMGCAMLFTMLLENILPRVWNDSDISVPMMLFSHIFHYIILTPILVYACKKLNKNSPIEAGFSMKSAFSKPKAPAKKIAKWIFIALSFAWGSALFTSIFFTILQNLTGRELAAATPIADGSLLSNFTIILTTAILAPLFEEIIFRGVLLSSTKRFGGYLPIILNALLFGLFHINYPQVAGAFVTGVCMGFLVVKTGSIIPAIITHFIFNGSSTIINVLMSGIDLERIQNLDMAYARQHMGAIMINALFGLMVIGVAIAGLILFIVEMVKNRGEYALENNCKDIPLGKKTAAFYLAPVTAFAIIFMTAFTVVNALDLPFAWVWGK
jgi:membrane protease YdiL (CAAX protease family)